jgi:hypothetical protein
MLYESPSLGLTIGARYLKKHSTNDDIDLIRY